jgi:hypothetical protein
MRGYETCTIINYDDVRGADLADNYTQYYTMTGNQFKKYYTKTFRHMMDMCVLHVYHVHRKLQGKEQQLIFLIHLAKKLTQKYGKHPTVSTGRPSLPHRPSQILYRHFPVLIPATKKQKPTKCGVVCYETGQRKGPRHWFPDCNAGL